MSDELKPQHMAVAELAHRCAQETQHYFQQRSHDTSYCFELFRRALEARDQAAWEIICIQYQPLVSGWVRQHRGFEATGEEIQYFVNGAFGKISGTLTPGKFSHFSDIGALLRYLKMCVHSVIVDHNRVTEQRDLADLEDASEKPSPEPSVEEQAMDDSYRQAFWEWINARLQDEQERAVIYGSFSLDLKPQELCEHFRSLFTDVDEVYRVKQNVIARLRRDPEFRKLVGGDD
jgi:hypothetical protein